MQAAAAQARDFGCCRHRLPRVFRLFTFKVVTVVEGLRLHVVQRHVIRSSSVTDAPTAAVGDDERKLAHDFRPRPSLSRSPSHVSLPHSLNPSPPHSLPLALSLHLSLSGRSPPFCRVDPVGVDPRAQEFLSLPLCPQTRILEDNSAGAARVCGWKTGGSLCSIWDRRLWWTQMMSWEGLMSHLGLRSDGR